MSWSRSLKNEVISTEHYLYSVWNVRVVYENSNSTVMSYETFFRDHCDGDNNKKCIEKVSEILHQVRFFIQFTWSVYFLCLILSSICITYVGRTFHRNELLGRLQHLLTIIRYVNASSMFCVSIATSFSVYLWHTLFANGILLSITQTQLYRYDLGLIFSTLISIATFILSILFAATPHMDLVYLPNNPIFKPKTSTSPQDTYILL